MVDPNPTLPVATREYDVLAAQSTVPRKVDSQTWARFEANITEIFTAMGLDLATPGTESTPRRFLTAMFDVTEGYEGDPQLITSSPTECNGTADCDLSQVIEGPIAYHSLCEHHAFPFFGKAYVAYVAYEDIIGISKLTRLVRLFARRFTVQERMGSQIADVLQELVSARGVAVYLTGSHLCTQMRGVQEVGSITRTTTWRGVYADNPDLRREFLDTCLQ